MTQITRRDFLKLTRNGFLYLSGTLILGGFLRFLDFDPNPAPKTEFDLGPSSKFPLNSRTLLSDPPVVLLRTPSGFAALSLVCTHLGCTVEDKADGFTCPCHGSHFDNDGNVTNGPAEKHLHTLRVEVTPEGNVKLFTV